jgi:hypothetical protein
MFNVVGGMLYAVVEQLGALPNAFSVWSIFTCPLVCTFGVYTEEYITSLHA